MALDSAARVCPSASNAWLAGLRDRLRTVMLEDRRRGNLAAPDRK